MKKAKIIISIILLVCMVMAFTGCDLNYGNPDKLEIGKAGVGTRILIGLQVALIGIGMVFVVLLMLILLVKLMQLLFQIDFKKLFAKKQKKEEPKQVESQPQPAQDADIQAEEEVVAVIMASLIAYYEASGVEYKSNLPFKVRSIKQIK